MGGRPPYTHGGKAALLLCTTFENLDRVHRLSYMGIKLGFMRFPLKRYCQKTYVRVELALTKYGRKNKNATSPSNLFGDKREIIEVTSLYSGV